MLPLPLNRILPTGFVAEAGVVVTSACSPEVIIKIARTDVSLRLRNP
jgi:hypothetical protein